jgi:hypothetical protein
LLAVALLSPLLPSPALSSTLRRTPPARSLRAIPAPRRAAVPMGKIVTTLPDAKARMSRARDLARKADPLSAALFDRWYAETLMSARDVRAGNRGSPSLSLPQSGRRNGLPRCAGVADTTNATRRRATTRRRKLPRRSTAVSIR